MAFNSYTLLQNASANGDGTSFDVSRLKNFSLFFEHEGKTTGADLIVQVQSPSGKWHTLATATLTGAAANELIQGFGPFTNIRASLSNYTDGNYWVYLYASDDD